MAIKVKHEGNVTSRITAAGAGGRGKRAADDGKAFAQIAASEAQAGNRQLQGAHASPVSPGHASAPLTHAAAGSAPGIMHAPSGGGVGGSRGSGSGGSGASGAGGASRPMKVTGDKFFNKPDAESVWDWDTHQWKRAYLPGEWEAEVQQRVGDVRNTQQLELIDVQHKNAKERAEQSALLGLEGKVKEAQLNAPPRPGPPPAVQTPFPSVPETPAPTPPKVPEKPGSVSIIQSGAVADSDMPELYNMMQSMQPDLLKMRGEFKNEGLQGPFDKAMTIALKAISKGGPDGALSTDSVESGGSKLGAIFDSILAQRGGVTPAVQTPDEIESVYANGGSIFGDQSMNGSSRALSWLNPPDMDAASIGGDAAASKDYASSVGGMIDAFLHRNNNYV